VIYKGVIHKQSEVARYYQASDMLVYPSFHREGLALSVVEAMSSGLPVLTTDWAATETGMRDLIIPGKTGFVFNGNSHLNLARQLCAIHKQASIIRFLGKSAREHVLTLGVDDRVAARKYLDVYKELVGKYK
jgi:glycosyltransferase involved in cell wall biosynthesis